MRDGGDNVVLLPVNINVVRRSENREQNAPVAKVKRDGMFDYTIWGLTIPREHNV